MTRNLLALALICTLSWQIQAQNNTEQPQWITEMLSEHPNVWQVDALYHEYYRTHPFVKTYYTQQYKRWRRTANENMDANGNYSPRSISDRIASDRDYQMANLSSTRSDQPWTHVGPDQVWNENNEKHNDQTNVYSIDVCASQPQIMYSGTEPGEIYKSTDGGATWFCVSMNINLYGGIGAVAVDPSNPDNVLAGSGSLLKLSTDGGQTWQDPTGISAAADIREILFDPNYPAIVLVASGSGLYRSTDGGANFSLIDGTPCWDIKYQPGNSDRLYLLKSNESAEITEFFISEDDGLTWIISDIGWYNSTDPDRIEFGGRIGVSPADPNRVYAYLIGDSKSGDIGYIGLFRSNDAGASWTLPNGPVGGPFTDAHPNLARGWAGWDYHQGYYNCAIAVSKTNADSLLIGGLNMWRSNDGAVSFSPVGGYMGNTFSLHPDMQDFRETSTGTWATSDGGIYHSTDFFTTIEEEKSTGIRGTDYWGFGQGWNTNIFGGGAYHNGNTVYNETYNTNQLLQLGGGEASTGYANPASNYKMYFSDLGGRIVPQAFEPFENFSFALFPNESYGTAESSEIEFHPESFNTLFLGRENKLWKSTDGGLSFSLLNAFGNNEIAYVHQIEISYDDPNVMYVSQQPASGNTGFLWKTTNGGLDWTALSLPNAAGSNRRRILLSARLDNKDELYLAFPSGLDGNKIFKTTNGGTTWTNITSAALNNESVHSMSYINGTDGGVYLFTERTVFYKSNTMPDWVLTNTNLPAFINTNISHPFYRDGKIRFASYGKSIWEAPFYDAPTSVIAQPMSDKLNYKLWCNETQSATFDFECHSVLNHTGATWVWNFQDGTPSTSNQSKTTVQFSGSGQKLVTLTITDAQGNTDIDSMYINIEAFSADAIITEDFENGLSNEQWRIINPDNQNTWSLHNGHGGYGNSQNAALFNNYEYNANGQVDDLVTNVNLSGKENAFLTFDVAYAQYNNDFIDSLKVLVSTDCGETYTELYAKAGPELATAPDIANYFFPTDNEWRTDTVFLSDYSNQAELSIAFRNVNGYGNLLYLDNINLQSNVINNTNQATQNTEAFSVFPNPVVAGGQFTVRSSRAGTLRLHLYDTKGRALWHTQIPSSSETQLPSVLSTGTYTLLIESENSLIAKKLLIMD